jgi:uncharacterized protein YndB with AHSA1/START domain
VPLSSSTSIMQQVLIGPIEPEVLFATLTDPDLTPFFFNLCSFKCDALEPGAPYTLVAGDTLMAEGVVLEYQPPANLLITFQQRWDDAIKDLPSRVRFFVQARPPLCELSVINEGLTEGSALNADLNDSWVLMTSALKTLVETGRALPLQPEDAETEPVAIVT